MGMGKILRTKQLDDGDNDSQTNNETATANETN